jgi:hypothetical protein
MSLLLLTALCPHVCTRAGEALYSAPPLDGARHGEAQGTSSDSSGSDSSSSSSNRCSASGVGAVDTGCGCPDLLQDDVEREELRVELALAELSTHKRQDQRQAAAADAASGIDAFEMTLKRLGAVGGSSTAGNLRGCDTASHPQFTLCLQTHSATACALPAHVAATTADACADCFHVW